MFSTGTCQNMHPFVKFNNGECEQIRKNLYIKSTATNGWLERFKTRKEIVFKKLCRESNSVEPEVTAN